MENHDNIIIGSTSSNPLSVDEILPNLAKDKRGDFRVALLLFVATSGGNFGGICLGEAMVVMLSKSRETSRILLRVNLMN